MARMNVKLLNEIKEMVLAEPRRLNMYGWGVTGLQYGENTDDLTPPCGTVACFAGWAILLKLKPEVTQVRSVPFFVDEDPQESAERYLRLSREQSDKLFFTDNWPKRFSNRYRLADTPQKRAAIAAKRIDFFVATNGTDKKAVA